MVNTIEYKKGKVLKNGSPKTKLGSVDDRKASIAANTIKQKDDYDPNTSHHKVTVIKRKG